MHGTAFISASNPTLNKAGVNVYPALDRITLSNRKARVTTVLMENATAIDLTSNANAKLSLNLIDPDSMIVSPEGNLVLDNQAGAQLIFISQPGTKQQFVSALPLGDQVDDTVWPTSPAGRLLVSDTGTNTIYAVHSSSFVDGTAYAASPSGSPVSGMVSNVDQSTGILTPVVIGLTSPHGMTFVPDGRQ
jgi:hypothetical protein